MQSVRLLSPWTLLSLVRTFTVSLLFSFSPTTAHEISNNMFKSWYSNTVWVLVLSSQLYSNQCFRSCSLLPVNTSVSTLGVGHRPYKFLVAQTFHSNNWQPNKKVATQQTTQKNNKRCEVSKEYLFQSQRMIWNISETERVLIFLTSLQLDLELCKWLSTYLKLQCAGLLKLGTPPLVTWRNVIKQYNIMFLNCCESPWQDKYHTVRKRQ